MLREFAIPPGVARPRATPEAPEATAAEPVPVRDAATVMLVRDSGTGRDGAPDQSSTQVEVFAFRRIRTLVFAAGMLVYPGGAVEKQDDDGDLPVIGTLGGAADGLVPLAVAVAAARETFEECGVLLASPDPASGPMAPTTDFEELRVALIEGRVSFAEVLRETDLALDLGLLHLWAHWITPAFEPRRFDTRFFVARVPEGQEPRDLGGEGENAGWVDAADAVRRHAAGELPMMPPTLVCMEELAAAGSVANLFATTRHVRPVSPWVHLDTGPDGEPRRMLRVDLDGVGGGEPR